MSMETCAVVGQWGEMGLGGAAADAIIFGFPRGWGEGSMMGKGGWDLAFQGGGGQGTLMGGKWDLHGRTEKVEM